MLAICQPRRLNGAAWLALLQPLGVLLEWLSLHPNVFRAGGGDDTAVEGGDTAAGAVDPPGGGCSSMAAFHAAMRRLAAALQPLLGSSAVQRARSSGATGLLPGPPALPMPLSAPQPPSEPMSSYADDHLC